MSPHSLSTLRRALQHLADTHDNVAPRREPSHRAQEIYRRVTIDCEPQKAIAQELGITPSRVSKIVARVRTWLAQGSQGSADALSKQERRRLELALAKARHEGIYHRSIRDYDHQHAHPTSTTIRTDSKPSAPTDDSPSPTPHSALRIPHSPAPPEPPLSITKVTSTTRPLPPAVQLLKAAQRSALELQRLAERDNLPDPQPEQKMPDDDALYSALHHVLFDFRRRVENQGRVPKSTNIDKLISNFLSAFLGIDQGCGAGFLHLDDSIRHFLKTFLVSPAPIHPRDPAPEQLLNDLLANHGEMTSLQPETSASPQPETCNLEPETSPSPTPHSAFPAPPLPTTSYHVDHSPSPPNSSPTPIPTTPSSSPIQEPNLSPPPHFAYQPYPHLAPDHPLNLMFHPWSRPS